MKYFVGDCLSILVITLVKKIFLEKQEFCLCSSDFFSFKELVKKTTSNAVIETIPSAEKAEWYGKV